MATIEKEKALDVVRQMVADGQVSQEVAEKYFPELKESEDERIRNLLYCLIRDRSDNRKLLEHNGVSVDTALAWIEKQGEHHIACSEEQMKVLDEVLNFAANHESPYWNDYIFETLNNFIRQLYIAGNNDTLNDKDEEIRKALINVFATHKDYEIFFGVSVEDILAWLERQGKKVEPIEGFNSEFERLISRLIASIINKEHEYTEAFIKWTSNAFLNYAKHEIEKQVEQKSADRVEPKFKVGDWIYHEISGNAFHINRIENRTYISDEGATISFGRQNDWRIWTIQNAKDGDVLVCESGERTLECLFIFKLIADREVHEYCSYRTIDKHFSLKDSFLGYVDNVYHPANQEQRDTLIKAMTNAGYTFDFEKKELKKIELRSYQWNISDFRTWQYIVSDVLTKHDGIGQYLDNGLCKKIAQDMQEEWSKKLCSVQHPSWSEEDEAHIDSLLKRLEGICKPGAAFIATRFSINEDKNWLQSLKDKVHPMTKQEWSDEDERMLDNIEWALIDNQVKEKNLDKYKSELDWFKSLKDRYTWKPSEEQMDALRYVFKHYVPNATDTLAWDALQTIELMLDQLKKLKKE